MDLIFNLNTLESLYLFQILHDESFNNKVTSRNCSNSIIVTKEIVHLFQNCGFINITFHQFLHDISYLIFRKTISGSIMQNTKQIFQHIYINFFVHIINILSYAYSKTLFIKYNPSLNPSI